MERAAADFALSPSNFKEGLNITPPPIPIRLPSVEVTNDKIKYSILSPDYNSPVYNSERDSLSAFLL